MPKTSPEFDLPKVQHRSFKNTVYNTEADYATYDVHWVYDAKVETKETEFRQDIISTADVFFTPKGRNEWLYGWSVRNIRGHKKYRCVGGPLDGKTAIIGTQEYVSYNCAENPRSGKKKFPTGMLIHSSLLR